MELRHRDLSGLDLSGRGEALFGYAVFDTATRWPERLPAGYDPERILELGKDPGLGVRELHRQGITGEGVRVAFLDQTLLVDHEEYRESLERYREIGNVPKPAQMHATAIFSLLAGKEVGVAPGVSVTWYAVEHHIDGKFTWVNHARAIQQILDENAKLPLEERIRVIGVSLGYGPQWGGYREIRKAIARAKREGVLVLTTTVEEDYDFRFHGLGRHPLADPNDPASYRPGSWWRDDFFRNPEVAADRILAPMDARAFAAPCGPSEYTFYQNGGWSWVVPYLTGMYALGLQVKPDLTPEEFYHVALETGTYTQFTENGRTYRLGPILNPGALIDRLRGE